MFGLVQQVWKQDEGMSSGELTRYFTTTRSDLLPLLPETFNHVLEIGCSAGGFSAVLMGDGVEVWGVEPNEEAALVAESRLTKVLHGTFEEVAGNLPSRYFDLVICNDVIEHMSDHDKFLQLIKSHMKEKAILLGSLPNIRHVTSLVKIMLLKDFPYSDEGILDRTHLRFFTRRSIIRSLNQNGYDIEIVQGVNNIIRDGLCGGSPLQNVFWRLFTTAIVVLTFGYYADVIFPQFAFRATLAAD